MGYRLTSPIPNDTREALALHNWQIDNIALLLNKYLDFLKIESIDFTKEANNCDLAKSTIIKIKGIYYRLNSINKNSQIKNINFFPVVRYKQISKNIEREAIRKVLKELKLDKNYENRFIDKLIEYRNHLITLICNGEIGNLINKIICRQKAISDKSFTLTTQSRLVVGLGSGSVLETSIKLHHIYGIPYIPSSAIKGVLRAYRIWELAQWDENRYKEIEKRIEENKPNDEEEKNIIKIFGNQQQKGKLIFLDAYPENFEGFDIDIMNPHFPEYYDDRENKVPPADWQNPRPITFLTIPEGTKFIFFFKNIDVYDGNIEDDLKEAFQQIGIGGKTSLGYGILE